MFFKTFVCFFCGSGRRVRAEGPGTFVRFRVRRRYGTLRYLCQPREGMPMGSICRLAAIACLVLAGLPAGAQERLDRTVDNKSTRPAWVTLRYPDLGPDASSSRCVGPGASARFVAEPGRRAVVSAESRPAAHCGGVTSCKASTEWPGEQVAISFVSDGKTCTLGVAPKSLGMRPGLNWGQLFVENESKTHALFVRVSPPPSAKAREDEFACIRPGYSARFLVPPGEEENWKRGRYHRFIEAEWIVPGDRTVAMHATDDRPRNAKCQLELVR